MKGLRARLLTQAGSNLLADAYPAVASDYYQSVIDSVSSVIFTVDRELHIIGVNRQWDAFVLANGGDHLTGEHVLERPALAVLSQMGELSLQRWQTACHQILNGQIPRFLDEILWPQQSIWRHYTLAASPLKDSQGGILGITFVATNITQLKKAETEMLKRLVEIRGLHQMAQAAGGWFNQRAFYRQVTADIAHLFAADKCIIFRWSERSGHLQAQGPAFGLTERELIDLSLDIGDPANPASLWDDIEKRDYILLNEGDDAPDSMVETSARVDKLAAMMGMLRVSGRVHGIILVAGRERPFSDQDGQLLATFAVQVVLTIESAELNQRLLERTQQLFKTREELTRMGEVAESLRRPVTVMQGYLELLLDDALGPVPEGQAATIHMLLDKIRDISDLVNRLSPSRFLPDITRYEPTKLVDLVHRALDKRTASIEHAGLELSVQLPASADAELMTVGDRNQLLCVFDALLDNIVSFAPDSGTIHVSLHESNEICYVKISHSEADIPEHRLLHIWQAQVQTGNSDSIGLSEVKQIVEEHGGQVWVESRPGQGSAFYVALPKMANQ